MKCTIAFGISEIGSKARPFEMKGVGHGVMDKITAAGRRLRGSDDRRADNIYKYVVSRTIQPICPSPFLRKTDNLVAKAPTWVG